jgi:hypothetical protein
MSSEINGSKTQIIVAVIALIGVIGGAVITNWDKFSNQNQGSPPKPTPVILAPSPDPAPSSSDLPTPSPEVNISGVWRDNTLGTTSQVAQEGSTFKFTVWGTACIGGNFQSSGDGTIRGNSVESHYQSNFSQGTCSGTVSSDGRRMTSICKDTVCGQFQSSAVRQ